MPDIDSWTLVDLLVVVVLAAAATGAVRRGGGLLAGLATLVTAGIAAWLVVSALATWGPAPVASAARHSGLLEAVPAPARAFDQVGRLVHDGPDRP